MLRTDLGDPGLVANNTRPQVFATNLPGGLGFLAVFNDTPYAIDVDIPNGTFRVSSGVARLLSTGDRVTNNGIWRVVASIAPTQTLYSDLYVEAYGPSEDIPESYPLNIIRQQASNATVIANELGTTADGLTVRTPPLGTPASTDVLVPYNQGVVGPTRDIQIDVLSPSGELQGLMIAGADGSTHVLQSFFVSNSSSLDGGELLTDGVGHVTKYGNVATAGQGVPPVRASLEPPVTVTAITQQNVLSFTPVNNGLFVAYMRVRLNNGTSGQLITARVAYTDPDTGATPSFPFQFGNSAGVYQVAAGAVSFTNQVWDCQPLFFRAKGGSAITLQYTDPANTPNDQVSGAIIQIA